MIVCPVCEHAQAAGADCEVCGKRLVVGPAGIPSVPPLDGLEETRLAWAEPGDPPAIPGLEHTRHVPVDVAAVPALDVEPTRSAPVDVAGDAIPDVERTEQAGIPDDGPTLLAAEVVCASCGTEAMLGERVCGRCGMRLPAVESFLAPLGVTGGDDAGPHPCPSCGVPATGARCPSCGGRLVPPPAP